MDFGQALDAKIDHLGPSWSKKAIKNPDQQTDEKMLPKKSRNVVRLCAVVCKTGGKAPYKLLNQLFQGTVMGH